VAKTRWPSPEERALTWRRARSRTSIHKNVPVSGMVPDSLAEPEAIARTRWLEVLRLDAAGTGGRMGPRTSGGLMVVSLGL